MKVNPQGVMKQHAPILVALLLTVSACVNHDFEDLPQRPTGRAVSFRTETQDNFSTRAAGHTGNGAYAIRSIGIYAAYTTDVWDGTTAPGNFFNNLSVSRSTDSTPWSYDNEQLWPATGYLSFFAYAPHKENAAYGANQPVIDATIGTPTLTYIIAPTHANQVDLLVATPVLNQTKRDYITLPLRHALTKIAFSARVVNQPADNTQIRVTQIELSGLYGSGTIVMNGQNRQWTPTGNPVHHYTQSLANSGLNNLPLSDTYSHLTPTAGHLFLLPQTLAQGDKGTGATATITYEVQVGTNAPETKSFDLELARAIGRFNPGDAYNLMFTINNGVTFIVAPTAWDNTEVTTDVKNRILNVSRIEAGVYDGAVTRIHFWSNQPKEAVYVLPIGNIDAAQRPTGAEYNVNSVFQNLAGATAANLYYPGFDGTLTSTGEGYIDIVHSAAYTGNTVRHIWLNASGLTRSIRLSSSFEATPVSQPYIGTFHRYHQVGERIVAWEASELFNNNTWTATILPDNDTAHEEVVIDRMASPFFATRQLYTTDPNPEAAGDAEAATVDISLPRTTSVSGMGKRIYFRVGWRSPSPHRAVVRYARIRVTKDADNSELTTLYLRQGEEPDFVMRPTETGTSMNTRPHAVKFSPYNLTAQSMADNHYVAIDAARTASRFTDYPTQAGALFQWANSNNQRVAYSPYNPIETPTDWNSTATEANFWAGIKSAYETCPPGYRRPADGSVDNFSNNMAAVSEVRQSLWSTPPDNEAVEDRNSAWGYYADGYFDRRKIVQPKKENILTSVSADDYRVAYIGRIFYHPSTHASLFFPAAGARKTDGTLAFRGISGDYWTTARPTPDATVSDDNRSSLIIEEAFAQTRPSHPSYAHSVRCIRDMIFNTELPPYDETAVPTALAYIADAGAIPIDQVHITRWNATLMRDLNNDYAATHRIVAKITFKGTTAASFVNAPHHITTQTVQAAVQVKGSTLHYNFNDAALFWKDTLSEFAFDVHEGWSAEVKDAAGNTISLIVGKTPTPGVAVISDKGSIVFTRTETAAP